MVKRPLTTCFRILTAVSLSSSCMLSASEDASEGKPELAARQHRSAMGAREGYRMGRRMGVQQERVRALMARLDSDGDQRVTVEEMHQDRFAHMDKDGDGYLTPRELINPRRGRSGPPPGRGEE